MTGERVAIQLQDVRFAYPGAPGECVLSIRDWRVSQAEQVFVYGPSGAGKSTLLKLLSGLLSAPYGEVSVLGQRLDRMSARRRDRFRANHIGQVLQQSNLIPYLNAVDNIQLANTFCERRRKATLREDAGELLSALNMPSAQWQLPAARLSLGQQQRVAIARALINQPEILIADEPTSSLDRGNRDRFMDLLKSQVAQHGMTLLFVSHDLSLSRHFARVEALEDINQAARGECF